MRLTPKPNTSNTSARKTAHSSNTSNRLERNADVFCQHSFIFPVTDAIFDRTADLWVTARNSGLVTRDADTIIAATALEHGRVLVTDNTRHFAWIPQLRLADWRQP